MEPSPSNNESIESRGAHDCQPQSRQEDTTSHNNAPLLFTREWDSSDVIVVVNGNQEYHAHQSVLCLASSVFKTLLSTSKPSSNNSTTRRLEIDLHVDVKSFELFLQFIYPQYTLFWSKYS